MFNIIERLSGRKIHIFVECELYRMKKPESSLRKKWDEGIRPCSFDEVENFMSMAISEAYEKGKAEERRRIVNVITTIQDDLHFCCYSCQKRILDRIIGIINPKK